MIDYGRAGILIPSGSDEALSAAITLLLQSAEARQKLAKKFNERVRQVYSAETVVQQISGIYDTAMGKRFGSAAQSDAGRDVVTSQTAS